MSDIAKIVEALNAAQRAIGDWVATYAPEHSGSARADEAIGRLNAHGTLAYLADVDELIESALAEARAAQSGEWVMVPREPTQEMIKAAEQQWLVGGTNDMARREWHAMLAAAPPAPAAEPVAFVYGTRIQWTDHGRNIRLPAGSPVYAAPPPVAKAAEPVAWQARFRGEDGWGPWWDCRERDLEVYNELPNWETRALGVIAPPPVEASPLPGVRVVSNPAIPPGEAYIVNGDEMHRVEASQQQPSGETTRPLSDLIQLAAEIIRTSEPDHEDYAWPATVPRYVIRDVLRSERAADQKRKDWGYKLRLVYDRLTAELSAAKAEAEAMRKAIQAAIDCGMVPTSSAREGGACAYSVQAQVADMLRDAITAQQGGSGDE